MNGKLAYIVNYFASNNTNTGELFYDGKKVKIHDGATNYTITNDFIQGVPEITDKLSYYTYNLGKFFFGNEVYPKSGVIFEARSIGGKLYLRSQAGTTFNGQKISESEKEMANAMNIGGKLAYIKRNISKTNGKFVVKNKLFWDGKEYAEGNITSMIDYNGYPAYILNNSTSDDQGAAVVMYKGKKITQEYPSIFELKVIGGKLAFLAQKNSVDLQNAGYGQDPPLYKLIWGEKEYGTQYDTVMGYIDSARVPAYMAANYVREDGQVKPTNAQYLVRGDNVVFSGKQGEEMIWQERELADVDGNLAIIVREPKTRSLYLFYAGKKFFEGYDIYYVRNVSGKLAVLAEKDRVQYVFIEK